METILILIMENKIFKRNENGTVELIEIIDIPESSPEQLIAEKEAELLRIYEEIQALKTN